MVSGLPICLVLRRTSYPKRLTRNTSWWIPQISSRSMSSNIPPISFDHNEAFQAQAPKDTSLRMPKQGESSQSFWSKSFRNNELSTFRSTETVPEEVDVAIIGSGMTGAICAQSLFDSSNPPESIVMLEAREFCSGATGRNAGHCKPDQWRGFAKYRKAFGDQQALKILKNEKDTWKRLVRYVGEENVGCDLWVGKTMDVIMTDELADEASRLLEEYEAAGGDISGLNVIRNPSEAERISKLYGAKMIISWNASTLSPLKLVTHIMHKCLKLGLNLQTLTPVSRISSSTTQSKWRLVTPRGSILAKTIIHATNAYAPALLPELADVIRPSPHMCNTVLPPKQNKLEHSYSVMYPSGIHTINPRSSTDQTHLISAAPNNPELIKYLSEDSSLLTDDGLRDFQPIDTVVKSFTRDAFGWDDKETQFDYSWSGIIGRSEDSVPFIGAVPDKPGQWICAAHNAHGMSRIFTAAPGLVKLIQGGSWEDTGLPECFEITPGRLQRLRQRSLLQEKKVYHPLR